MALRSVGTPNRVIQAMVHPSGFAQADSNFYSLTLASDSRLYYTLCSHDINTHGRIYSYDPGTYAVRLLGDLGDITNEQGRKSIPQGKSHTPFFEHDGRLYTATQYGFFQASEDKETPAAVPEGYQAYPGGHFIAYDIRGGGFEDLAVVMPEDGVIAMNLDPERERIYGLTWPRGFFIVYDIQRRELRNLGKVCRDGEIGVGDRYFCLCRSLGLVPQTGDVYFTNADGEILRYRFDRDYVESVEGTTMRRDIFGHWDLHKPGHQGYNWRDLFWHEDHRVFYGVHPKSAWLFRFDPSVPRLELIERICAHELRLSGAFEPFRYGYLTLRPGADGETIFYLTGTYGLTADDGRRVKETMHLVTYNLRNAELQDHGVLRLTDGRYPTMAQTMALHPNGRIYSCPWIENPNSPYPGPLPGCTCDLISFQLSEREHS